MKNNAREIQFSEVIIFLFVLFIKRNFYKNLDF